MTEKLASYAYGEVVYHRAVNVLELVWNERTAEMVDDDFKRGLELLAEQAEAKQPRGILIDATSFRHQFAPGVMEWRDARIIPRYAAAGVQRFAFQMPAGFPDTAEHGRQPEHEGPAPYPTQWFGARDSALAWLEEPGQ